MWHRSLCGVYKWAASCIIVLRNLISETATCKDVECGPDLPSKRHSTSSTRPRPSLCQLTLSIEMAIEPAKVVPETQQSAFLALPPEIRLLVYEAYFGNWSCIIGSTGLHSFAARKPMLESTPSTGLLSSCKQIHEEISAHRCFHKSFTGITRYTRGCCLSRVLDLKQCWVLKSTKHVISYFFDNAALQKWRSLQHFPHLETIEIEDTQYWSLGLSLHATVDEALRLFKTKEVEYALLWSDDNLRVLREVVDRDGINVIVGTFLTARDSPSCNAFVIVCVRMFIMLSC